MTKNLEPRHIAALQKLRDQHTDEAFPEALNELLGPPCVGEHSLGAGAELNLSFCGSHIFASFGGVASDRNEAVMNSGDIGRAIALLEQARDYLKENIEE
jgi:hypothetical protein